MTDRLVIDTCVFVEGIFKEDANPSKLLLESLDQLDARLVFSQNMIGELMYILKRSCNHFGFDEEETSEILFLATSWFRIGKSTNTRKIEQDKKRPKSLDKDDQMFIDAAYSSKASHIITLDKKSGILKLKNVPFICCTPESYLTSIKPVEKTS